MKNLAWHQRDYDLTADLRHCKYLNVDLSKTYCLLTVFYVFLSEVPVPAPGWRLLQVWLDARLPGYRRCPSSHHLGTRPIGHLAWSRRCKCGATFHHAPPVATGQPALDPSISQSIDKYFTKYVCSVLVTVKENCSRYFGETGSHLPCRWWAALLDYCPIRSAQSHWPGPAPRRRRGFLYQEWRWTWSTCRVWRRTSLAGSLWCGHTGS